MKPLISAESQSPHHELLPTIRFPSWKHRLWRFYTVGDSLPWQKSVVFLSRPTSAELKLFESHSVRRIVFSYNDLCVSRHNSARLGHQWVSKLGFSKCITHEMRWHLNLQFPCSCPTTPLFFLLLKMLPILLIYSVNDRLFQLLANWNTSGFCQHTRYIQRMCIQNSAARIVTKSSNWASSSSVLQYHHWLPVQHRIR